MERKSIGKPPQSWAEFWDVERFPGIRSLRKTAQGTLEAALMADGVEPGQLYPLDLDRAIRSLRRIKPHIKAWWGSGAESQQLMKDGGIQMIGACNARIDSVVTDGAPMKYTYNQGIMDFGCWAIVKGSKKKDLAMRILAEFVKREYQAEMSRLSKYGAANMRIVETGKIRRKPPGPAHLAGQPEASGLPEPAVVGRERRPGRGAVRSVHDRMTAPDLTGDGWRRS